MAERKVNISEKEFIDYITNLMKEYNKQYPDDPIVEFSGQFKLAADVTETTIHVKPFKIEIKKYRE